MKRNGIVAIFIFSAVIMYPKICPAPPRHYETPGEQERDEQTYDKLNILHKAEMLTDTSEDFITIPSDYPDVRDFDVAKTPPTIDFAIVQGLDPWYLPPPYVSMNGGGIWASNGDVTKGPDDCYYYNIHNHMSYGGTAYIFKYDPAAKTQNIVVDLKEVVGTTPDDFADGKFHGDPDIGPGGDMWLLSFFGPRPTSEELDTVYRGGSLIRYNIFSGETENLGIPLEGESWPYHSYDWERGVLFAVGGISGNVLAYNTRERKIMYGGAPKKNISWNQRGILLDRETGIIYTSTPSPEKSEPHVFASWKRRNNSFSILKSHVPPNPVTGEISSLRSHTRRKDASGAFWCFSANGAFFKFYPAVDRVELFGVNWGKKGKYIVNMCLSPGERYIYYVGDAMTKGFSYGTPVIQYDIKKDRKKVIAFLADFYVNKYGYGPGGTYGVELDREGASLFLYTNGQFTTKEKGTYYGRPAIFHVHIPESERVE